MAIVGRGSSMVESAGGGRGGSNPPDGGGRGGSCPPARVSKRSQLHFASAFQKGR